MIEDEIPLLTEKDFYLHALSLPLSGMFFPDNIPVSYEEYLEQKKQAETFFLFTSELSFDHIFL